MELKSIKEVKNVEGFGLADVMKLGALIFILLCYLVCLSPLKRPSKQKYFDYNRNFWRLYGHEHWSE